MRFVSLFALLLFPAAMQSCNDEATNSDSPKILWKVSVTDGQLTREDVLSDIQYNGGVLLNGFEVGNCLYFVDIEGGKIRWKWTDYLSSKGWVIRWPYQNEKLCLISYGRELHCINLMTGQTAWKRQFISGFSSVATGIGDKYYIPADNYATLDGPNEGKVITGSLLDGTGEEILLTPEYTRAYTDPNNSRGSVVSLDTVSINGEDGLLMFFWDPLEGYKLNIFIGLYNLNQRKWVYSKKPFMLNAAYTIGKPVVKDNKVINSVGKVQQCHDLLTGEILWKKQLSDINTANDAWIDGKIISTTQDRITHCIDPETGKELWALTTSGNPGIVRELNGIAYMVGGNAKLFAIDVAAGKILWQFDSPDMKTNSNAFWQEGVRIVPGANGGKGKIIVSSYLNAYCYEAIR
jgi:outer membrane protein assembly factor BamB